MVRHLPPSAPPSVKPITDETVFVSSFLDIQRCSLDERRIFIFLFDHREQFFSEAEMRGHAGYVSRHGIFVNTIEILETQLNRMRSAPFRLLKKLVGENYVYAIVSKAFYVHYFEKQKAKRTIELTSLSTHHAAQKEVAVQEKPAIEWDFQQWLDTMECKPITGPLRFASSLSSVNSQVESHCMYIIAKTLAANKNTWVNSVDLENALTASLLTVTLPARYSWETHFIIKQLINNMRSNTSMTKNNKLLISTRMTPQAFMLEVPPNFQG